MNTLEAHVIIDDTFSPLLLSKYQQQYHGDRGGLPERSLVQPKKTHIIQALHKITIATTHILLPSTDLILIAPSIEFTHPATKIDLSGLDGKPYDFIDRVDVHNRTPHFYIPRNGANGGDGGHLVLLTERVENPHYVTFISNGGHGGIGEPAPMKRSVWKQQQEEFTRAHAAATAAAQGRPAPPPPSCAGGNAAPILPMAPTLVYKNEHLTCHIGNTWSHATPQRAAQTTMILPPYFNIDPETKEPRYHQLNTDTLMTMLKDQLVKNYTSIVYKKRPLIPNRAELDKYIFNIDFSWRNTKILHYRNVHTLSGAWTAHSSKDMYDAAMKSGNKLHHDDPMSFPAKMAPPNILSQWTPVQYPNGTCQMLSAYSRGFLRYRGWKQGFGDLFLDKDNNKLTFRYNPTLSSNQETYTDDVIKATNNLPMEIRIQNGKAGGAHGNDNNINMKVNHCCVSYCTIVYNKGTTGSTDDNESNSQQQQQQKQDAHIELEDGFEGGFGGYGGLAGRFVQFNLPPHGYQIDFKVSGAHALAIVAQLTTPQQFVHYQRPLGLDYNHNNNHAIATTTTNAMVTSPSSLHHPPHAQLLGSACAPPPPPHAALAPPPPHAALVPLPPHQQQQPQPPPQQYEYQKELPPPAYTLPDLPNELMVVFKTSLESQDTNNFANSPPPPAYDPSGAVTTTTTTTATPPQHITSPYAPPQQQPQQHPYQQPFQITIHTIAQPGNDGHKGMSTYPDVAIPDRGVMVLQCLKMEVDKKNGEYSPASFNTDDDITFIYEVERIGTIPKQHYATPNPRNPTIFQYLQQHKPEYVLNNMVVASHQDNIATNNIANDALLLRLLDSKEWLLNVILTDLIYTVRSGNSSMYNFTSSSQQHPSYQIAPHTTLAYYVINNVQNIAAIFKLEELNYFITMVTKVLKIYKAHEPLLKMFILPLTSALQIKLLSGDAIDF